jgi:type II secretory pathway component PulM
MNRPTASQLPKKLGVFFRRVKVMLSKDYSLQDVKDLLSKSYQTKQLVSASKDPDASDLIDAGQAPISYAQFDFRKLSRNLLRQLRQNRAILSFLLIAILLVLTQFYFLKPYSEKIQDQLELRPAQWSQLQSLVKLSKFSGDTRSTRSVTILDEFELEKIKKLLASKAIKPSVLRLTNDNPPQLEIQVSDLMFSVFNEILEDIRTTWRLYPDRLNIKAVASAEPGLVSVGGTFIQFGKLPPGGAP